MIKRILLFIAAAFLVFGAAGSAFSGVLTHDVLVKKFPSPLIVGQKDGELPVWPVFKQNATTNELVGYLFESIDFASIPGFSGVPVNLLIALDARGGFLDVQVLSHHEPVFLDGLGEAPLVKFVSQYRGLSLKNSIAIDVAPRNRSGSDDGNVHIDGVAKATASIRIINQSILSAALKVARKKLGFSGARDPDLIARIRQDVFEPIDAASLAQSGLIKRYTLGNAVVEKAFAGTPGEGIDPEALAAPENHFIDVQAAYVSVPSVGRNLLTDRDWKRLSGRLDEGDHAVLVMWRGRYDVVSDNFIAGTVPDRLTLSQGGLPIEMRDLNLDLASRDPSLTRGWNMKVFRVIAQAGLDPSQPLDLRLRITRLKGIIYPERISQDFKFDYRLPSRFYAAASNDNKSWQPVWKQRWPELAVLMAALAVLFAMLARPKAMSASDSRFRWFRTAYLVFTLFFIGWYAQGQLSIVNITGVLQALKEGRGLEFLLYDPVTLVLWGGVLVSLCVWGRGTFCGWLCPFGALQELAAKFGRLIRLPQISLKPATDARLKRIKYLVLGVILASSVYSAQLTDRLVELEPFKTAITLNFVRFWPFVAYAVGLIALNMVIYKFFCRYLCPLGAGLAVLGRVRIWSWLPRRVQCGKPCQTCRHRCEYEAIRKDGRIHYEECFQCMDCVVIHESDEKCAPLIMERKTQQDHSRARRVTG